MILTRSPLRITLGGGGTDLPSYYERFGGFVMSAAIDKYVYVSVMRPFVQGIFLKYSKFESVTEIERIQHPIFREALRIYNEDKIPQIEMTTMADIPSGTGLGSSGSFTTGLVKALATYYRDILDAEQIARKACEIEIDILKEPIGKQDQYIAAYGGITCFDFEPGGGVNVRALKFSSSCMFDLEDNLLLFFTGYSRSASEVLQDQKSRTQTEDPKMIENLNYVKEMGLMAKKYLLENRPQDFGNLMHEHWEHKKKRSGGMSNPKIDEWYELGRNNGAIGGKLVGAGGGGFLLFYAEDRAKLREAMYKAGLEEVRFRFDFEGTKVIL